VLGVDENLNSVSGCSIDSSVHFMQQLEKEFDIDLMEAAALYDEPEVHHHPQRPTNSPQYLVYVGMIIRDEVANGGDQQHHEIEEGVIVEDG
jgi:hypothetical protein